MAWYDINNIAFELLSYPISYIELLGTVFGLLSVYLASRANILTWPTGIANEVAFFLLFYQVRLYADMFLQVYFFVVTVYGWYFWKRKSQGDPVPVTRLPREWLWRYLSILILGTILLGLLMTRLHLLLPAWFPEAASYPFPDAFTTVASVLAMILLSRKKWETWLFWIAVDSVAIILYFLKGIHFVALEYVVFLIICIFGLVNWKKELLVD